MRRTDRLFELIQLFRGDRFWRGQDLADKLEISLRTLYRDIETLVASGVPIQGERGVGYILREPIFLPPLSMTSIELEALQLGVRLVGRTGDADLAEAARSLQSKIDAALPSDRRGKSYSDAISLYAPRAESVHAHLPLLRHAIRERERLILSYRSLDGAITERRVRPLHLEYWGRVWTLTCWCEKRDDFRSFRVDRIETAVLDEAFSPEAGKTYADFLARLAGPNGKERVVT